MMECEIERLRGENRALRGRLQEDPEESRESRESQKSQKFEARS